MFFFCVLGDFALVTQSTVWRKDKCVAVEEGEKNLGGTFTRRWTGSWLLRVNLKASVQRPAGVSHEQKCLVGAEMCSGTHHECVSVCECV